jgi:hypothetical protein
MIRLDREVGYSNHNESGVDSFQPVDSRVNFTFTANHPPHETKSVLPHTITRPVRSLLAGMAAQKKSPGEHGDSRTVPRSWDVVHQKVRKACSQCLSLPK